jgi:hypothetical protein
MLMHGRLESGQINASFAPNPRQYPHVITRIFDAWLCIHFDLDTVCDNFA